MDLALQELPRELAERVESELAHDERAAWLAQPSSRRAAARALPICIFAVPWTAFAVFWICGAAGFKIPDFSKGGFDLFPLFGVPFVLIGLGMLSAPWWAARAARATAYVITDRRALIIALSGSVRSFTAEKLKDLERRQRPDGSGDIVIERTVYEGSRRSSVREIGFFGIPDAKRAEDLLRQIR
jgi:hypothetical protein